MVDVTADGGQFETPKDAGQGDKGLVRLWVTSIDLASKTEEDWRKRAAEAEDAYRDESDGKTYNRAKRTFPILFSNVETLAPAIYNSRPVPDIRPRFNSKDEASRLAASVLERAAEFSMDNPRYDWHGVMKSTIKDVLLAGRGAPRVRYKPYLTKQLDPMTGQEVETLAYEEVCIEAVPWDDLRIGPARCWDKVPWIAFRHFLTREQVKRLNPEIGATIPLDTVIDGSKDQDTDGKNDAPRDVFKRLLVWEVWDKAKREVHFIAPSYSDGPLRTEPDPLELEDFWPIPAPMYAIRTSRTLLPIEPYRLYKDQARELERVTQRINGLINQLKVRGIYNAALSAAMAQVQTADDGEYSPAEADQFMDRSLDNVIWNWPLESIAAVLVQLYQARDQIKQTIYEITGIGDIMRGVTQASETLGAQQIKAQWGSLRIQDMQADVQRMARDIVRMMVEIISNKFAPETLQMITGEPIAPQVHQLIQSDLMRSYRIDIETDSTIQADTGRAQEQISQFLQGTGLFFQSVGPAVASGDMPKDVAVDLFAGFARTFKLGKQAEDALSRWTDQTMQEGAQGQQPGADPQAAAQAQAQAAAQVEMQAQQAEMQMKAQETQARLQADMQKAQMAAQTDAARIQFDREKFQAEAAFRARELDQKDRELELKAAELRIKAQEAARPEASNA